MRIDLPDTSEAYDAFYLYSLTFCENADDAAEAAEEILKEESKENAAEGESAEAAEKAGGSEAADKTATEIAELKDRFVRQMAEFDNFRKRTEREKAQMFETGAKSIIEKILPVVDNFERGLNAIPEEEGETGDSFVKFLPGLGLTKVQIVPHYDETMASVVDGKKIDNIVLFDSRDKKFLGLPDGSYLNSADGHEMVYGPFYTITAGKAVKTEAGFMAKSFD